MKNLEKNNVVDVFTPTKPARLTFVEREKLNEKLVNALKTPGKQIIVYGHSGSGKTTLLINKLHQLYENHLTTRCIAHMTFEHIILNAFDQLNPYYLSEKEVSQAKAIKASLISEYIVLKSQVEAYTSVQAKESVKRYIPPQLTIQTLAKLLGSAKLCWVLEDFHKLPDDEKKKLAQSMKVFMDMSDDYPELKIVAIGAVDTARQVVDYDPEMINRVAEIHVPLMTDEQILSIIRKGEKLLNFSISPPVCDGIVSYANGLASVCHSLCLNICNAAGIVESLQEKIDVTDKELSKAVEQYIAEASDTLKSTFDKALKRHREVKYDNCRLILEALAVLPHDGATHAEILQQIQSGIPEYPAGNLTNYLKELQSKDRGAILRCDHVSGKVTFSDPILRTFALALFDKDRSRRKKKDMEFEIQYIDNLTFKKIYNFVIKDITGGATKKVIIK